MAESKLILVRHGQSMWNMKNLFTGWVDVPLSEKGIQEALKAGDDIKNYHIDKIFVSELMRAQQTAMLMMSRHSSGKVPVLMHNVGKMADWASIHSEKALDDIIPVTADWHLNERYYGHLQGANKDEAREKYGEDQVHIWRRSYDVPPPEGESLELTAKRTIPYFKENIDKALCEGQNCLVAAHGNSLRSIVMELEGLSKEEVLALELATGKPRVYNYYNGEYKADG